MAKPPIKPIAAWPFKAESILVRDRRSGELREILGQLRDSRVEAEAESDEPDLDLLAALAWRRGQP